MNRFRMLKNQLVFVIAFGACFPWHLAHAQNEDKNSTKPLRAMSFNIRLGVAEDGDNHWDNRKDLVIQTIRNFDPDFVGTQETWNFQAEYFRQKLPEYTYVGRSRQQDNNGEQCGILFRNSRFDRLVEGHFWLSESPDRPGSKSWDSSLPRMVTWLKLWDRENSQSFYVINTHFDHRGPQARVESARMIRNFIKELPANAQAVVTGDFNATVDSEPYRALFGPLEDAESPVIDSFRIVHPEGDSPSGTFNGFKGTETGARIDWIAVSRSIETVQADIDRSSFDGRFPSDHFPVTAVVKLDRPAKVMATGQEKGSLK